MSSVPERISAEQFRQLNASRSGGKREFALGRLAPGEMNKTEARYEAEVLQPGMLDKSILWYAFGAVTLRLAPNTHLKVDFFVLPASRELQAIDVKGAAIMIQEDAHAKMKIAAAAFPWRFFYALPLRKKDGGGWDIREIGG